MGKWLSVLSLSLFSLLLVPISALAEDVGEEVAAEPSGILVTFLTVMALATIVYMIYLCVRDNG